MNNLDREVVRQTLELSETIQAGLVYVRNCLEAGSLEEGRDMMTDLLAGMSSIRRAMPIILNNRPEPELKDNLYRLRDAFEYVENSYRAEQHLDKAWALVETIFLPVYEEWQEEMYKNLNRYVHN